MKPLVEKAVEEIRAAVPKSEVTVREDGQGGAYVIVEEAELGDLYVQTTTWIGFRIPFQCPNADVYPHFVRGDLTRKDGQPLGKGTSKSTFEGRPAVQLSRRSNRLNPLTDTPLLKMEKVLHWLRAGP